MTFVLRNSGGDPRFISEAEGASRRAIRDYSSHEDHVGALPFLWRRFKCPVYTTRLLPKLLRRKLLHQWVCQTTFL